VIALVDYRAGNLTSVRKALAAIDADVFTPADPESLGDARGIIVPGVGHFSATRALDAAWTRAIRAHIDRGRPLLGICLGLQWLYEASEEAPDLQGLGVIAGACRRLRSPSDEGSIKVPHVGWNSVHVDHPAPIVDGVGEGAQVYFTHSYVAPVTSETVATTTHGECFASIVQRGAVAGVQFHPEKSGEVGLRVLRNFLAMTR
jgi:imidazole glycerol-phosphate synthase subunit HisH